jgi:hypothetical protein
MLTQPDEGSGILGWAESQSRRMLAQREEGEVGEEKVG